MVNGLRGKAVGRLSLLAILCLLCACSKKQTVREGPPRAAVEEGLVFLSAVQGNPVCMVVGIDKYRSSGLFSSAKTQWRTNAWLLSPGIATYLGVQKGKSKEGPSAPVSLTKDRLLFTTDKEEFVYYVPGKAGKVLLFTDPLFADRVRSSQEAEIRYGRMPAKLFWNNRTVEGSVLYERWAWTDLPREKQKVPFPGLEPGGRLFVLWGPGGELLFLEKEAETADKGAIRFAVMQGRRGRWRETYQVRWSEPECAFSSPPCAEGSEPFRLGIPAWDIKGSLEVLREAVIPAEEPGKEGQAPEKGPRVQDTFWTSLRTIPQAKEQSPCAFCLLKGNIWVHQDQRAVYGIGFLAKQP